MVYLFSKCSRVIVLLSLRFLLFVGSGVMVLLSLIFMVATKPSLCCMSYCRYRDVSNLYLCCVSFFIRRCNQPQPLLHASFFLFFFQIGNQPQTLLHVIFMERCSQSQHLLCYLKGNLTYRGLSLPS